MGARLGAAPPGFGLDHGGNRHGVDGGGHRGPVLALAPEQTSRRLSCVRSAPRTGSGAYFRAKMRAALPPMMRSRSSVGMCPIISSITFRE